MKLLKDKEQIILLSDTGNILLEMKFFMDEFVINIYKSPIIITKDIDVYLFENLKYLMQQDYEFQHNISSYKKKNKLLWISDQYYDIEDEDEVSRVNRLLIEDFEDKLEIKAFNPYFDKIRIKKIYTIAFSPCGNGVYTKNIKKGTTLQDDIVLVYQNILNCKLNSEDKVKKR